MELFNNLSAMHWTLLACSLLSHVAGVIILLPVTWRIHCSNGAGTKAWWAIAVAIMPFTLWAAQLGLLATFLPLLGGGQFSLNAMASIFVSCLLGSLAFLILYRPMDRTRIRRVLLLGVFVCAFCSAVAVSFQSLPMGSMNRTTQVLLGVDLLVGMLAFAAALLYSSDGSNRRIYNRQWLALALGLSINWLAWLGVLLLLANHGSSLVVSKSAAVAPDYAELILSIQVFAVIGAIVLLVFIKVEHQNLRLSHNLSEKQHQFSMLTTHTNVSVFSYDRERILFSNPALSDLLGRPERQITGASLCEIFGSRVATFATSLLDDERSVSEHFTEVFEIEHSSGEKRWLNLSMAVQKNGTEVLGIASGIDITQQKKAEMKFRDMAQQDDLTRLANRNYFLERLDYIVQLVGRSRVSMNAALFLIDVSDLRNINEDFGLVMGDRVLQTVGARIQSVAQSLDVVARVTGGKFGFIYRQSEAAARSLDDQAELLVKLFYEPVALGIRLAVVNVHIGVVPITGNYTLTDTLLRDAEVALQAAKESEVGNWAIYDANMDSQAKRERALSNELKAAVDTGALQFYYQPIIDIKNQRIVGFESLCRWQRNNGEWVSPGEFIPLAERFGLVLNISLLAIIRAGQQIQHWRRLAAGENLYVSVNVDAQSLVSDELLAALDNAKMRFQLQPGQIKLELTEHALMENPKDFLPRLNVISKGGFPLMLDDFGTGYSSLSYLHQMPIAIMKIDRSFVSKILEPQTEAIGKSIIALASSLNIAIVSEGIETKEQSEKLLELGCHVMQGFYFAKPMPAADIDRLVSFAKFSAVKNLA